MSKVTLTQLRDVAKGKEVLAELNLEINDYVSLINKRVIAENVEMYSVVDDDGKAYLDPFWFEMFLGLSVVRYYTNVDFSYIDKSNDEDSADKMLEFYDLLEGLDIINMVYENSKDALKLKELVVKQIKNTIDDKNSLISIITKFISTLPEMGDMEKAFSAINGIDGSKLDFIKDALRYDLGDKNVN